MRFEYQVRPNSTFSAIFTAECGLWPVDYCQLFGGEAFKVYVRTLTANRRINSTARDFYSLYRLLKNLKRKLSSLFVGKGKRIIMKLLIEEFNFIFFTAESAWPVLNISKAATFWRILRHTFHSLVREITLLKGNLCIYKCFMCLKGNYTKCAPNGDGVILC